jgi:hypothetical protein
MSSTQPQAPPKLSECRKCKENGFYGIMIAFENGGNNRTTNNVFWLLKNTDGADHKHTTALNPAITTTAPPVTAITSQPAQIKSDNQHSMENMHDRPVETELQQTRAIMEQTLALKELASSIKILTVAINNKV